MKKFLSLFVVAIMAMSMFVITASADDGFYPVDSGNFQVIGDWDFEEATIADNVTIPDDGTGTVTYANGGVTFTEEAGGKLPTIDFLPSKVTSAPTRADYVYYEFTVDMREISQREAFRLNIFTSTASSDTQDAGFITISPELIQFRGRGGSAASSNLAVGDIVGYTPAADENKTKIGMLVNLDKGYYAGYINGEMVCEKQLEEGDARRTGYMSGKANFRSVAEITEDYAITIYDYKFYKGVSTTKDNYTKAASWDFLNANFSGSEDAYSVSTTDGLSLTMTADAEMPEITLPGQSLPGTYGTDMYYYEFVVNSGNLSNESGYVIYLMGKHTTSSKEHFAVGVGKNTLTFQRGNGNTTLGTGGRQNYDIPAALVGTDIKIGLLIDQNDGSNGKTYVYINREKIWSTGNNSRILYHPFNQAITISSANTLATGAITTTQTTGDQIIIKSVDVYHCVEGDKVTTPAIPEEGAFSATASYNVDSIAAADGQVTATVTLTKAGNAGWYNKDVVFVASYAADGSLLDVVKTDGFVKGGQTTTITKTVKTEVGGQVRVFLWDDMKTLVPVETFSPLQ